MAASGPDITREDGASKGRYVCSGAGAEAAASYSRAGARLVISDHADVPHALRGQGAGAALVLRAEEDPRAEGRRILPLRPFASAQFRRRAGWADVVEGR